MKSFIHNLKDAVDYALEDKVAILVISSLVTIASLINKNALSDQLFKLFNINLLIVVGYGSYVSWYALKGRDEHPSFKNNLRRLIWEGFKKSVIVFIYSAFLWLVGRQAKLGYMDGSWVIVVLWSILFILLYLCLIGGLLNRYLNKGEFLKAFNLVEIVKLLLSFDIKSFIKVIFAVVISQIFSASIVIRFGETFGLIEFIYSIAVFFLAPFLYIAMKRFIALNVYELLEKKSEH